MKTVTSQRRLVGGDVRRSAVCLALPWVFRPLYKDNGHLRNWYARPWTVPGNEDQMKKSYLEHLKSLDVPTEEIRDGERWGKLYVANVISKANLAEFESELIRDIPLDEVGPEEWGLQSLDRAKDFGVPYTTDLGRAFAFTYSLNVEPAPGQEMLWMPISGAEANLVWTARNRATCIELLGKCGFDIVPVDEPADEAVGDDEYGRTGPAAHYLEKLLLALRAVGRGYVGTKESAGCESRKRLAELMSRHSGEPAKLSSEQTLAKAEEASCSQGSHE